MTEPQADDRRALHDAMVEAFPTYGDLEQFCRLHLDLSLASVVQPCGVVTAVFELFEHLRAHGREPDLLDALTRARADHAGVAAAVARLRGASDAPPPLPRLPRFLGRDAERDALAAHVAAGDGAVVCLRGPPGAGKSTLALAVLDAPPVAARFRGRRWLVRLDGARSGAAIWGELRQAMDLPPGPVARDVVRTALGRGGAIVLDNGETPWDDDPEGTAAVLRELAALRGVALLLTIRGDRELPVDLPWRRQDVAGLTPAAARELFEAVTECPATPAVTAALAALAHLPLAIVLLGAVVRKVGVDEALRRWEALRTVALELGAPRRPRSRFARWLWRVVCAAGLDGLWRRVYGWRSAPTGGAVTALDVRHRSWLAVVGACLRAPRVGEVARGLARGLAELPDGMASDDLVALGGLDAHDDAAQLVETGLAFRDAASGGRLRMLAPVREGVRELLRELDGDVARVTTHYTALLVAQGDYVGKEGGRAAVARLGQELGNLEAAIRFCARAGDWEGLAAAARRMARLYRATGDGEVGWLVALLRDDPDPVRASRATALEWLGDTARVRSDHDTARKLYEEARLLFVKVGDAGGEANCIRSLGDIALARLEYGTALRLYEEARPLFVRVGNARGEATCVKSLGDIALQHSDRGTARRLYEEAQTLFVSASSVLGEANCIRSLGDIALARFEYDTAQQLYERARTLYVKASDKLGEANCINSLGDTARLCSDRDTAQRRYAEALVMYRLVREPYSVGRTLRSLARLAGAPERARYVAEARAAWCSIDREDLLADLDLEFPP